MAFSLLLCSLRNGNFPFSPQKALFHLFTFFSFFFLLSLVHFLLFSFTRFSLYLRRNNFHHREKSPFFCSLYMDNRGEREQSGAEQRERERYSRQDTQNIIRLFKKGFLHRIFNRDFRNERLTCNYLGESLYYFSLYIYCLHLFCL